ncbi:MAG: nucleotidyltransferase family protein [Saprospiraceae bacterium]|nr:nucleotidyltransferase family protein [Saprospiraceae bacterium]
MKAMIFAAGLGTRLRPLTNDRPKALVEVNGVPLLQISIEKLRLAGITDIIVNIHHFGEQIAAFLARPPFSDMNIAISDERAKLLDTGGGLRKAAWFFDDGQPFLVYNADILTTLNLNDLYAAHTRSQALATLAVRERPASRAFLFDKNNRLCGWRNSATGAERIALANHPLHPLAFSGVHVIHPRIFELMPPPGEAFSIVETYLSLAQNEIIQGFRHDQDLWLDVGKPEQLARAQELWTW